ncbi:MAG: hypothetical protein JJU41_00040 [Bacteroidetes bacterium]|nr:hypothetical protein [Bacteroidota bacterium]
MKKLLKNVTLVLIMLCPVFLYGQNHPELDVATSFAIYKNGQNIFVEYAPFHEIMGAPDVVEEIDGGAIHMQYGLSKFWFILGFYDTDPSGLYFVELNDASYRVNINGVDIRVGELADELAEHFPKSWAARRFNWPSGDGYPKNDIVLLQIDEMSGFAIIINPSTGVIRQISYSMRLT